jgi:acyl-CoA thioester hydrolase
LEAYRVRVPLRWVDMDAQAHINNAHVVDFLQEARVDFLLNSPHAHLLGDGIIVVEHRVEYLAPARFDGQEIDVDLWVGAVGAAQFWLGYDVRQGEATVARARTQLANFDFVAGRPARLAPAERAWFAGRSTDVEEFPSLGEYAVGEAFHEHPIAVRWSDLDSYGHVNNVRFFDYVAEARIAMRESLLQGSITGLGTGDSEHTWMVARQDLRYRGQVRHRLAPYAVRTAIGRVGRTSLTLVADLVDPGDDAVLATATSILVHGDARGVPSPLPAPIVAAARVWAARGPQESR